MTERVNRHNNRRKQRRKRDVYFDATLIRQNLNKILDAHDIYDKYFKGKRYIYHYKNKNQDASYEINYFKRNFMHLCGVLKYPGGAKGFYEACLERKVNVKKVGIGNVNHFKNKLKIISGLRSLAFAKSVGITNGTVCYKNTDFGTMIRTRQDLLAIGTVKDVGSKKNVPLSLINVKVDQTQLRTLLTNYINVDRVEIITIN